jgi:hypothetical protein
MARPRFMDADVISVYLFLWMLSRRAAWATAAAVAGASRREGRADRCLGLRPGLDGAVDPLVRAARWR